MATKSEKDLFKAVNSYRKNPVSVKNTLENFLIGMKQLHADEQAIKEFKDFYNKLEKIPSRKEIKFSEVLTKEGHDYLKKAMKSELDNEFKEGKNLKGIINDSFISNNCALIMDKYMDPENTDSVILKLCASLEDNKKIGYKYLNSDLIKKVGIAIEKKKDLYYTTFIFSENEEEEDLFNSNAKGGDSKEDLSKSKNKGGASKEDLFKSKSNEDDSKEDSSKSKLRSRGAKSKEEDLSKSKGSGDDLKEDFSKFKIPGVDLTELRMAYELLDYDNKGKFNIKEALAQFEEEKRDVNYPVFYEILKGLDNGKEYVTWPEFATHCHSKMSETSTDAGRKRIFDIFLPDKEYKTVDYSELTQINDYLKLKYKDQEIKDIVKGTKSQVGVDLKDFTENIKGAKKVKV